MSRTLRRPHRRSTCPLSFELLEDRCLLDAGAATAIFDLSQLQVDQENFHSARILVQFRSAADAFALPGTELGQPLPLVPGLYEVHLAAGMSVEAALASYQASSFVVAAEADARIQAASLVPNDPGFGLQWGLHNTGQSGGKADADIDAPEAWASFRGSGRVIVAVIDTGVNYQHPDLAANIWVNPGEVPGNGIDDDGNGYVDDVHGYDFVNNDGDPMDDHGHGTHVAGIIGAVGNNGVGVAGIAWKVQIMALKFLDASGAGYTSDAIRALNYAVANGAVISNNSWGGGGYDGALYAAIQNARAHGHIFVAAAGNDGRNLDSAPSYPANYALDNVVAVAALDRKDNLASFSNYGGATVHVAAPGVSIYSTLRNGAYGYMSGTSMAAPFVAGALALIRDAYPDWSYKQVIDQLFATVDPVAGLQGKVQTGGRINLARALAAPAADTAFFVRQVYLDVLKRPATDAEATLWTSALYAGTTREQFALTVWNSFEHRMVQVDEYYQTLVGRSGSTAEKTAWANAMTRGLSENQVVLAFVTSSEYQALHPSNTSFIQGLYADLLGRTADAAGLAFWQDQLARGLGREAAARTFLNSGERHERLVDHWFQKFLGRPADAGALLAWTSPLASGRVGYGNLAVALLSSQEYFQRAAKK